MFVNDLLYRAHVSCVSLCVCVHVCESVCVRESVCVFMRMHAHLQIHKDDITVFTGFM